MKKIIAAALCLVMVLALCACGSTAKPDASSQPSKTPDATTELTAMLTKIKDDYHSGTAGSSLTAASIAGEMLDWYIAAMPAAGDVTAEATAFCAALDSSAKSAFIENLGEIYAAAMDTCGSTGKDLLSSAGYTPKGSWTDADARNLFDAVYAGTGAQAPVYAAIYFGNEQADGFVVNYAQLDSLNPDSLVSALVDMEVLAEGTKVLSFDKGDGKTLKLDMSEQFGKQMSSTGTAGEYIYMGSLVNTFLAAYGADSITVTCQGKTITTGHAEYTEAMTMFSDNAAG